MNGIDPLGLFPWLPIGGGVIGGATNAYDDYGDWKSGNMTTGEYAGSIALGFGTGALSTMGGAGLWSNVIRGATAAAGNEAGRQYLKEGEVKDPEKVARHALYGAAGNAVGHAGKKTGDMFVSYPDIINKPLGTKPKTYGNVGGVVGDALGTFSTRKTEETFTNPQQRNKTGR